MSANVEGYSGSATYGSAEVAGVAALVAAGVLSFVAVVPVLAMLRWYGPKLDNTRLMPFFFSLLVSNVLQAIGAIMNSKWMTARNVVEGPLCSAQGGIKQAGNLGVAVWSFAISLQVFMILFIRRVAQSAMYSWVILGAGWVLIAFTVAIGPLAIQTKEGGPYFGPTGFWCWITENYPREQFYLEYFFEFVSAGVSFLLYTAILLRVRGNLVRTSGRWQLRFVPHGERWRLAIRRDVVDSSMMAVAARMVWYPVAYTILLLPVTIARFVSFSGHAVPFRAMIFADFVFNIQGLVNVLLLLATRRFVPDTATLPLFAPRMRVSMSSPEAVGITPFVLPPRDGDEVEKGGAGSAESAATREGLGVAAKPDAEKRRDDPDIAQGATGLSRSDTRSSRWSASTTNSQTPFVPYMS